MPQKLTGKTAEEYCLKWQGHPDMTVAKLLYNDFPLLYMSLDSARAAVRYYRSHIGATHRKKTIGKATHKPLTHDTNPFKLPESQATESDPFIISQSRTLILSDLHIPYQNNQAIELALKYGQEKDVDCILINGDTWDFATISRHEKDWRNRTINVEFDSARMFFRALRSAFPKKRIIVKWGNHCERWEKYLYVKAPELFDCSDFQLEVLMKFGELQIESVKDKRFVKIGKLSILHGHELLGMGGVNPARATFLKVLDSVLVGHYHRTSSHVETTLSGDVISVNSTGCLCSLNPLWLPINKWNLGFAYVEHDIKTGEYRLENLKIIKGKIY